MINELDKVIDLLIENRNAILLNIAKVQHTNDDLFQECLNRIVNQKCRDIVGFTFCTKKYFEALHCARNNKINTAKRLIENSKAFIDMELLSDEEIHVYNSITYPIDAYLFYKEGFYDEAVSRLLQTIELDKLFEKQEPVLSFHRIQQLQNIIRIRAKEAKFEEVSEIFSRLFEFLLNRKEIWYKGNVFNPNISNDEVFLRLIEVMLYQVFSEMVLILNNLKVDEYQFSFLKKIFGLRLDYFNNSDKVGILLWMKCKYCFYEGNEQYLNVLKEFLHNSMDFYIGAPILNLISDLIVFCKREDEIESLKRINEIFK